MSEETTTEESFEGEQALLLPVLDDTFGIITQIGFKESFTLAAFRNVFHEEFRHAPALPDSEFAGTVKLYLRHGLTQEEAEIKAAKLCEKAESTFAYHAYEFFIRSIQSQVNQTITLLKAQSIAHAKIVLNKMTIDDDEGLGALTFNGADAKSLLKQELSIAISDVKRRHAEAKQDRDKILIAQAPESIGYLLTTFESMKEYHDEQKQVFFNGTRPQNDPPDNEKWQVEWLRLAKSRYGKSSYQVSGSGKLRPIPDSLIMQFADEDTNVSNPREIAIGFYAREVLELSGSRYRKRKILITYLLVKNLNAKERNQASWLKKMPKNNHRFALAEVLKLNC